MEIVIDSDIDSFFKSKISNIDKIDIDESGFISSCGKISPEWINAAYNNACFPWGIDKKTKYPNWFCPAYRAYLIPQEVVINRTLKKFLRRQKYTIWINRNKKKIIENCSLPRKHEKETWISQEFIDVYSILPNFLSFEVYNEQDEVVGGLYGLLIGQIFCGESQFSFESNTSKLATVCLCQFCIENNIVAIDCQVLNEYTFSMGAFEYPRKHCFQIMKKFANTKMNNSIFDTRIYELNLSFWSL